MTNRSVITTGALLALATAIACGSPPSDQAGGVDEAAVADIAGDLPEGAYEITVTGAWEDTGEYTGDADPMHYRRASDGSNRQGPHLFRLRTDVVSGDGESTQAEALVVLPDGITPGTYDLVPNHDPGDDEVAASFRSQHAPFTFGGQYADVDGTIEIGEVGERLTARLEYTAWDRDEESVTVEGRVHALPFEFRPEGHFVVTGDREEDYEGAVQVARHGTRDIHIAAMGDISDDDSYSVLFDIPNDVEPGLHPLTTDSDQDGIQVDVPDQAELDGEIRIERDGDVVHGEFDFTASGEQNVEVTGAFEHVELAG